MRDGLNGLGGVRERTDVASIIAEARKNMKANNDKEDDDTENTSGDEEEQAGSNNDESESESEDSDDDDDDDDNNDDSDSGDESSDDEVDDAEKMKGMDQDVVRDRKAKLTKNMIREQDEEDSGSDDDDDDDDESSNDSEDEEAKKEAAKAAKYFDQSHFHSSQGVGEKVEVFAQLNLSRPLLRGVASIGFVSPTPIQAKVIPIALSGRDVCAR